MISSQITITRRNYHMKTVSIQPGCTCLRGTHHFSGYTETGSPRIYPVLVLNKIETK